MPTARPFAYNPGATGPIPGTEQIGDLAIGSPTEGFALTGLDWFNGPDEEPGYVIAQSVPDNSQPTPIDGVTASVGFFRSGEKTSQSFVNLSNIIASLSGGGPFVSGAEAKEWLNDNGYWTSFSEFIVSSGQTTTGGFQVGAVINKDMTGPQSRTYSVGQVPGQSVTLNADYWPDWGDDIFDAWGYYYLYDPAQNNYLGLSFNTKNQADGVFSTQLFTLNGRTFTIKQGYPVQGIFKFEIRCSDDLPFVFGEGGNMGSNGNTSNIDNTYNYILDGTNLTLFYNENFQTNKLQERFYSYFVPFPVDLNNSKTYTDILQGSDNLYLYSVECTNGITVYHSKEFDVKEWVVFDLTFGS
jgi:hypothetical protein